MPAKVYFFPHPFTSERREETIESGATLESIVKNARSDIPHGLMVRTYVNGKLISNDERSKTVVQDDDEVVVRIVPANGNTDRETAAATKAFGGTLAALAFIVLGIATGGVGWVVTGFVIGIAAPFLAGLTSAGVIGGPYADEMGTINHPAIHGAKNQSNPNGKVPLVLGKHLMTPGYLSPPYTEISGIDGQDQYLYMAFILGYGPLKVSDIKLGDTLVASNSAGVTNGVIDCDGVLPGCEVEIRQDTVAGTGLSLYPKEVIEQDFQMALNRWHVLEANKELSGVTLTVNAAARTITRSSGDWTDNDNDVKVGDYVAFFGFANAGNGNRMLVTGISTTVIYCNQAATLVNESKTGVWANVWPSNIVTTAEHTTQISVTITFTKLVKYSGDDKLNATVSVVPEYRLKVKPGETPNAWITLGTFDNGTNIITRNKAETLRFTATKTGLTPGQYEVQVRRQTEDPTDGNIQDTVYWTALRSHTNIDIMPANYRKKVCILGIKIKSSEAVQNCITKLNCIVNADYSYITSKDAGHDWASIIATDPQNTALAFVHALMGAGNPRPRTASQLDWNSVYAFAQWCNTLKGLSGSKYRIETNGIVTQGVKLSELIAQILAPARASLTRSDGTYGVVWDALQTTPKQHIGPHNSWGFRGTKSFGEVIHGYRIKFINANEQYVVDERIVLDDGYKYDTEQDGVLRDAWGVDRTSDSAYTEATKFESIEALYMTNPAQVFGFGRYLLATRRLRPEMFTVNMDAENLAVKRGELVKVSHPAPRWGLADGRLTGITTDGYGNITAVETDNAVFMEAGKDYAVRFRTSTGASIYWPVATVAGDTHTLTLSSGIPVNGDMPAVGDMFFFGLAGVETIDCIVFGIDLNDDLSAKLTLFEAAPAVHNADAGAIPEFNSKVSIGPKASAPSTVTPVYPPSQDVIPYPATKALATLSDVVDFDGQYGIYEGMTYIGTMPNTWVRITTRRYPDVANATDREALTGMIPGDTVYQLDTRQWYIYTTSWVADGLPQLSEDDVEEMIPRCLGLFAYADIGTITGMHENDLAVLYSTTLAERGIYAYIGTTWTKQPSPTANQVSLCFVYVLDAVRQGYGVSSDYVSSSVSFETILTKFLYAINVTLDAKGYLKSSNYAEDAEGYPTGGFNLDAANNKIKSYASQFTEAVIRNAYFTGEIDTPALKTYQPQTIAAKSWTAGTDTEAQVYSYFNSLIPNYTYQFNTTFSYNGNTVKYAKKIVFTYLNDLRLYDASNNLIASFNKYSTNIISVSFTSSAISITSKVHIKKLEYDELDHLPMLTPTKNIDTNVILPSIDISIIKLFGLNVTEANTTYTITLPSGGSYYYLAYNSSTYYASTKELAGHVSAGVGSGGAQIFSVNKGGSGQSPTFVIYWRVS